MTPRTLTAILGVTETLSANWAMYAEVEAALLPSVLKGTPFDGNGRGTDVSDPTAGLATKLTGNHDGDIGGYPDTVDALEAILRELRWVQERVHNTIRQHPTIARDHEAAQKALRCSGAIDPLCTAYSVQNRGANAGLCSRCAATARKRRERQTTDSVTDRVCAVTLEAGMTTSISVATPVPVVGTCGLCGTKVTGATHDDVLELLAAHHANDCHG